MNKKNNLPPKWAVKWSEDPRFKEHVIALMKIIDSGNEACWTGSSFGGWRYYGYDGSSDCGGTNAWNVIPDDIPELTLDEFIEATEGVVEKTEEPIERKVWSENKVVKTNTYTITQELLEDGRARMIRTNDGFNAYELVGMLQLTINDIQKQVLGEIKSPDIIERRLIQDVPSDSEFCISKEDLQNIVSASEKLNELLHKCKI